VSKGLHKRSKERKVKSPTSFGPLDPRKDLDRRSSRHRDLGYRENGSKETPKVVKHEIPT
jgi:hypothetical protein